MSTRTVTATLPGYVSGDLVFTLISLGVQLAPDEIYPPKVVTATIDEDGNATVDLWCNTTSLNRTLYVVRFPGDTTARRFDLPPGDDPIDLAELITAGVQTVSTGDPILAVIAEMIADAGPGGGGAWGGITGTISDQTDLQTALDGKAGVSHVHVAADITDFAAAVALVAPTPDLSPYAPKASPTFTGTPLAPTAIDATSSTQIATTAFVHSLITNLIGAAPAALDTLVEIAAQLSTDESAVGALTTTVAGKLAKASNLSDLANIATAKTNLALVKADVGLGSVDNTTDAGKPVSTATQTALNLKANSASLATVATSGLASDLTGALADARLSANVPLLNVANPFTNKITTTQAVGAVSTDGFVLANTTPATVGAQKWSPRLHFTGQGWATTPVASQAVDWIAELVPVQGAANPTSNLIFSSQVNAAGYSVGLMMEGASGASFTGGVAVGTGLTPGPYSSPNEFRMYTSAGANFVSRWNSLEFDLNSGHVVKWATSGVIGTYDLSLSRAGAVSSVLQVGSGAANALGAVLAGRVVLAKTGNYTIVAASDNSKVLTNQGAAGTVVFTLPTAVPGLTFSFYVDVAQTLQVTAGASTTIRIAGSVSAAAGNITNATVGGSVTLVAISATQWISTHHEGTWVVT